MTPEETIRSLEKLIENQSKKITELEKASEFYGKKNGMSGLIDQNIKLQQQNERLEKTMQNLTDDLITGLDTLERNKRKYPEMKTQDVIDMLNRVYINYLSNKALKQ